MARAQCILLILAFTGLSIGGVLGLDNHAVKADVYIVKPLKKPQQKERGLMLRLKKPTSPFDSAPKDRMDPVEWLDSLLQGVYHPLDDKGQAVEDVPETRLGSDPVRRPSNKKRLNLKNSEFDRQFVYRPLDMGQLRLESPVRLERPLPVPAAFRNRERQRFRNGQHQSAFRDDFNAPINHRPNSHQSNQQGNVNFNQRPNYQQQNLNSQRPNYQLQIYSQQNGSNQDEYQQNNQQQDEYQQPDNYQQQFDQQQNYNDQQSGLDQDNYNQQQDYSQQQNFNQQQDYSQPSRPEDPYVQPQPEPYRPPLTNENYNGNGNNHNQPNRPPGRQYVVNVDVYVNQQRNRRNHRPKPENPHFRHSFRPLKK